MEFWPVDFRADASTSTKKKRKGKIVYRPNEQSVAPGSLGAATLKTGHESLEWITLVQDSTKHIPRIVGNPIEVFPPTGPPSVNLPRRPIHQRAEQGARFLRTYYPDVDISFELIKDELQLDENQALVNNDLDPYIGNRLAQLSFENTNGQRTQFLAFACGETGSELNVSPFLVAEDKRALFSPSAVNALAFDTPIQQVAAFTRKDITENFSFLAVRTHAVVSVVKLQDTAPEGLPAVTETVIPISVSETGNRRVVDMSCDLFPSSNAHILLVNDIGALYAYRVQGGGKTLSLSTNIGVMQDSESDHVWQIARRDINACVRTAGKVAHLFDLRARTTLSREILRLKDTREYLTSIEATSNERHTMCFATTSRLIWFDERNLKYPIFSFKHQRAFDRNLRLSSISIGESSLLALSSSSNHLVTVYDVNYAPSDHIQLHGEPSVLPGSTNLDIPIAGSLFFRHPDEESLDFSHFQLSSRGSLWKTNFKLSEEPIIPDSAYNNENFEWTEEMHTLSRKAKTMTAGIGNLGGREFIEVNLRGIYEKIFDVRTDPDQVAEEDAEAMYQALEKMPFFWQDMDEPAEHMLTTFDVAFQSGREPHHASRADFLTQSLLSSSQGFAALTLGRIPIPRLTFTVPWYYDLTSIPSALIPNLPTPPQILVDQLRDEGLKHAATPEGMRRATKATQRLALDLALSRHVYAPQSFSQTGVNASNELDGPDMLSRATKAMSLGATEPPPVRFGFLNPIHRVPHEDEERMDSVDESGDVSLEIPLGVRLLVSQWEIGSNPEEYLYKDPYDEQDAPLMGRKPASTRKQIQGVMDVRQSTQLPTIASGPRPPLVVSTSHRPLTLTQPRPSTQPTSMFDTRAAPAESPVRHIPSSFPGDGRYLVATQVEPQTVAFSDEFLGPSTQPLPGPFGGGERQLGGARKKVVKKRMGGF